MLSDRYQLVHGIVKNFLGSDTAATAVIMFVAAAHERIASAKGSDI